MKKLFLISFACIFFAGIKLFAVPAYPYPIDITQPDGTTLTITLKGDEFVSWAESSDGYTLLRNSDGFYEYAQKNAQGDLELSGRIAKNVAQRTADDNTFLQQIPQKLTFSSPQAEAFRQIRKMRQQAIERAPQRAVTGTIRFPLILVDFPNKVFTRTASEFQLLCNQLNYTATADGAITGSVRDYFRASSYNQLDVQVDVYGVFRMSHNISYYDNKGSGDPREMVKEAAIAANAAGCNFSLYDSNNDNLVDGIHVIYAGYDQSAGEPIGQGIWAHQWYVFNASGQPYVLLNGKYIWGYSCSSELRWNSNYAVQYPSICANKITHIGVICHEMSHVLGLPDTYDTDYEDSGGQSIDLGSWCLMAGGSWNGDVNQGGCTPALHSAWCRAEMGWIPTTDLTTPTDVTIPNPATQGASYRINTATANEYFLLENRQKQGFDQYIPASGLLIYHVDKNYSGWSNNTINANPAHRGLYIKQAGGGAGSASSTRTTDPYPQGTNNSFTDTSVPNSKSWAGANTAKPVTDIVHNTTPKTITFKFMGGGPVITPPTVTTQAATNINCNSATLNKSVTTGSETISTQGFEYRASGASTWITSASGTLTGLTTGTTYEFRAYATTASGTTYGSTLTFTAAATQTQTITFTAISTKTYGDAAITLPATSSAGLTISYQSSNTAVATVSGNTLTIVGAGTSNITASQSGNCDYTAATSVAQTLTVNKASLTVTADNKTREYGAANPTFTVTYAGWKNSDNVSAFTTQPTAATTATQTSNAATYPITPSGGVSNNYNFTYQNGTLTVNKASLTVTADNKSREYGAANPAFTVTYSGWKNSDNVSALTTQPTATTTATQTSNAATYPITPSGGVSTNYDFTYQNGTLTVNKASLTVTADNKSREYGAANPAFTVTYSGWKNSDNVSSLTTQPTAATTATQTSNAATYPITPSGGVSTNYDFTYQNGTLTVNKASLTVTADNKSREYGAPNPAFTVTYSGWKNSDNVSSLTTQPTAATTATQTSNAGNYTITPSGGVSTNYDFTYQNGTLTVTKAPLTVTADNKSREYGDVNPDFTVTYSGWKNSEDVSALTTQPTATTTATQTSNAGTYQITPSGGISTNYDFNYQNGNLEITKASLTVTAENKTRVYGAANPEFTLSFDGFKNDENESVLDQLPSISCNANATSPVGFYDIVLSGGLDDDYEYTLVNGVLEVTTATNNDNVFSKSISIYPNPVKDELFIINNEQLTINNVEILDIAGKKILTPHSSFLIPINVSTLPKGIYFIKIELENAKTVFEKFIKE